MSDTWFIANQVSLIFVVGQFLFQFPDMLICPEDQAYTDSGKPQHRKQECCAAAFSGAKQVDQKAVCSLCRHGRLKDLIHQETAKEIAHRDGEELKRVPGRKKSALDFHGNVQAVDSI